MSWKISSYPLFHVSMSSERSRSKSVDRPYFFESYGVPHVVLNQVPWFFQPNSPYVSNPIKLTLRSLGLTSKSWIPPCWSSKSPLVQQSIRCRGALRTRRGPRVRVRAAARARRSSAPPRRRAPGAGPRRWARSGVEAIGKNIGKSLGKGWLNYEKWGFRWDLYGIYHRETVT